MRKLIATLLLLLTAQFALGQGQSFINKATDMSTFRGGSKSDSLNIIPQDTLKPIWYVGSLMGSIAVKNGLFYWYAGGKYQTFDKSFSSLTGKPTTLSGYGITDAYPLSGNPSGFISSYTETDPTFNTKFATKSTSDLAEGTNKYYTDSKVQAVIDADTGRGVGNLATGGSLKKVSDSLGALIGGGGVSVASVAEVNTGTDNAKFASALAIEGSKYLDQDGSKIYAVTTGTATAYVLATTPSFTPATGTVLNVKFHLANTGAATINVNGSGAVALQKDLSTALVANDIPINSEYQLLRTSTGWLVKDIGLAGVTTGTLLPVRQSSPALLGTPTAPTASAGTNTTQLATTAFVTTADNLKANLASPTFTGVPAAPTASAGTNTTQLATTAFVTTADNLKANIAAPTFTGTVSMPPPNITSLSSGTTNDSVLVADATSGAVRRVSPSRLGGSGGLSGLSNNYVLKATSSTTVGSSIIQDNGTNLGINTAPNGTNKLHVNGGSLAITGGARTDNPGTAGLVIGNSGSYGFLQTYGSTPLVLNASFAPVMTGVEATATSQFTSFSDGYTHSGGYSDVISAKSTNYPSITLRETGSGLGNGWLWGLAGSVSRFIPIVNPRGASIELGYNGVSEGLELKSAADIQGISFFNTQSYKVWNQWNIGTNAIPSAAPQGSFATYGGDIGYAHIITKEGRHILSSPASADDGVNNLQVVGGARITGDVTLSGLPIYADNAAATAGGLAVGKLYSTPTGVLMVRY